jgi:hypothetical protein
MSNKSQKEAVAAGVEHRAEAAKNLTPRDRWRA